MTLNRTDDDRPGDDHPAHRLRPPGLHRPPASAPRAAWPRSAASGTPTTPGRTGAGAFTRTASSRARRVAERFGVRAVSRQLPVCRARSATAVAPRTRSSATVSTLAYVDLAELDQLLGGRLVRPAPGPAALPPRAITSAIPARRWTPPSATACRRSPAARPTGPIRVLTQLRSWGLCFNPVSFYYCLDAAGERVETRAGRGHQHPLGRAPLLPAARRRRMAAGAARALCQGSCTSPRSWAWTTSMRPARPSPAATLSVHIESLRDGDRRVRRDPGYAVAAR